MSEFDRTCENCAEKFSSYMEPTCDDCHEQFDNDMEAEKKKYEEKVQKLVKAAKNLGLACVNTGMYGSLKISPGKCTCSTCEMRKALKEWNQE